MKLLILGTILAFNVFASDDLKVQFPRENEQYFLGETASEIGQHIGKAALAKRAQALCEHLGYKTAIKFNSTILGVDLLKVNDLQDGKLVSLELKKEYKYLYSYHHSVINDLHCSNVDKVENLNPSESDTGREIVVDKEKPEQKRSNKKDSSARQQ